MLIKISLRDQVKKHLQNQMLKGTISFNQRISLPSVAKELNVSVTPIREALTQLEQANIVESIPNRGFFLPELSKQEAEDIYPIIAQLEHFAICQSNYTNKDIEELRKIQSKIDATTSPVTQVRQDLKFHEALLKNFNNKLLKQILADLKIRVFLYEFHYMQVGELSNLSSNYHRKVINHIEIKQITKAADLIKESWLTSIDFIKTQFDNNTPETTL